MRAFGAAVAAVTVAGVLGSAMWLIHDEHALIAPDPLTIHDPAPEGSLTLRVSGQSAITEPISAEPGMVIDITYTGGAGESGHAPCAVYEQLRDGVWQPTHAMGSAWDVHPAAHFGHQTAVGPFSDEYAHVCPAMNMIGEGPERFRLPRFTPDGPARLCVEMDWICIPLDYG